MRTDNELEDVRIDGIVEGLAKLLFEKGNTTTGFVLKQVKNGKFVPYVN